MYDMRKCNETTMEYRANGSDYGLSPECIKLGFSTAKRIFIDSFVGMQESPWNCSMAIIRFLRTLIVQTSIADSAPRL